MTSMDWTPGSLRSCRYVVWMGWGADSGGKQEVQMGDALVWGRGVTFLSYMGTLGGLYGGTGGAPGAVGSLHGN